MFRSSYSRRRQRIQASAGKLTGIVSVGWWALANSCFHVFEPVTGWVGVEPGCTVLPAQVDPACGSGVIQAPSLIDSVREATPASTIHGSANGLYSSAVHAPSSETHGASARQNGEFGLWWCWFGAQFQQFRLWREDRIAEQGERLAERDAVVTEIEAEAGPVVVELWGDGLSSFLEVVVFTRII